MENMGGLIELVLVFAFVLGFAVLELTSLRRYKKRKAAEDAARAEKDDHR
jgi:hypothetical protein